MNIKNLIYTTLFLLITTSSFAGGGWTKKKGKSYIKVAGWWVESQDFFSGNGGSSSSPVTNGLFHLNIYAEYGITDKLTAIGYVPFFTRSYRNDLKSVRPSGEVIQNVSGDDLNTFGDTEIGVKYSIFQKGRIALAGSVIFGLPFGDDGANNSPDNNLATGDGEFNQIIRADLGISIHNSDKSSVYGNVYVGYNNRTEDFSDEYRAGAELGAGLLGNKLWFIGKIDVIESTENGDKPIEGGASVFANNSEVVNLTGENAIYFTDKIGLNAAVSFPISGQFIYDAPAITAGLFLDIK
ncbi:hypothetical protein [Aquimarina agarivorans]|uniref:hypothetical protein n=1 Tax=Aquimarina agarivorans TaxID=980584 RepID=UPI000248F636|nr:hypothetical protein [Aquimarina agarivorans]